MISESNAVDILEATTKLDIHPEHEMLVCVSKWIEFCTSSNGEEGGDEVKMEGEGRVLRGGISSSDKPLLAGIVKILSMSENAKSQKKSAQLDMQLNMLFSDE